MLYINITDLHFYGHHGVYPEEKKLGQNFFLSASLGIEETGQEILSLDTTANYGAVCHELTDFLTKNTYDLIETAADQAALHILRRFPVIQELTLELKKPEAPIGLSLDTVSAVVFRKRHRAYISMGSNLGDRKAYLEKALQRLNEHEDIHLEAVSSVIETKPVGFTEQPDFQNACAGLTTTLNAHELLRYLHVLEAEAGRERNLHWGPRTLDLDLLLFDDLVTADPELVLPHPQMHLRKFVLEPLNEIAPWAIHPLYQKRIADLLSGR